MLSEYRENTVTETIDGVSYSSTKMVATKMLAMSARLIKIMGEPGLRTLALASATELRSTFVRMLAAGDDRVLYAITRLAEGMAEDPSFAVDLLSGVKCSALRPTGAGGVLARDTFEAHFAGELPHLFNVVAFVVRHNLAGFTLGSPSLSGGPTNDETNAGGPSA